MYIWNCRGRLVTVDKPLVMGIINATPDSFYSGSRHAAADAMLKAADKMIGEGADILDIGGQSSRPGSEPISAEEEWRRIEAGIRAIHAKHPDIIISVDTFYSLVARNAVESGAAMINDISAGSLDPEMIATVASLQVPYVLMHMKGTPRDMQQLATYHNVTREVLDFFVERIAVLHEAGIRDLIIDPGFGFAKTTVHNFQLLNDLPVFQMLRCPVLLGISRKSSIARTLGVTADEALNGTTVMNTIGLMNGASILRVHDVREAKEAVKLVGAVSQQNV